MTRLRRYLESLASNGTVLRTAEMKKPLVDMISSLLMRPHDRRIVREFNKALKRNDLPYEIEKFETSMLVDLYDEKGEKIGKRKKTIKKAWRIKKIEINKEGQEYDEY